LQKIANYKAQKTNNNQINNINDKKLPVDESVYNWVCVLIIEI